MAAERREDRILAALGGTVGGAVVMAVAVVLAVRRGHT